MMGSWALLMLLVDDPLQLRAYKHLQIEEGLRAVAAEDCSLFTEATKDSARAALKLF